MNPNTGELRRIDTGEEARQAAAEGLEPVPHRLNREARRQLGGRKSVVVTTGPLDEWAARQRKAKKRKVRIAKAARRKNRRSA